MFRHFDTGEARSGSFGEVRYNLDLTGERKHVGGEAESFMVRPVYFCGPPVAQQTISVTSYLKPAGGTR